MASSDFEAEKYTELHQKAVKQYKECVDFEASARMLMEEDLEFAYRDQWKEQDRTKRDGEKRPCIIVRRSKQFLDHIKNENRQNKPQIKVSPVDDGAQEVYATNRQGLIRHIQYDSKASQAIQRGYDFSVDMGRGWVETVTEYVHNSTFDQKLMIESVNDQFSIYPDIAREEPDYSDMKHCFKNERMRREVFEDRYGEDVDQCEWNRGSTNPWIEKDFLTVAKYYVIEQKDRELWRVNIDGTEENVFVDEIDGDPKQYKNNIIERRTIKTNMVKIYLLSGTEVLSEEESVFTTIPLVPFIGEETYINNTYDLKGVTRDIIDLGRQYNFYNSQETELMSNAPKTPYIGAAGQFEGLEHQWEDNDSASHYKEYNPITHAGGGLVPPPQRADFVNFPAGLAQGKQEIVADMQAVTGYYNTSSGATSNETSGTAIRQRINQGNTASFHFQDNANNALTSLGRIINDALPKVYKRKGRIITILGEDDEESTFELGGEEGAEKGESEAGNIGSFGEGEFAVVVSVGPSYNTKREEAVANMMDISAKVPMVGESSADLIIRQQDWPLKDEIAERTKRRIELQFPQLTKPFDDGKNSEIAQMAEQLNQSQQQLQQAGQQVEQMGAELEKVDQEKMRTDSMKAEKDLKEIQIKQNELELKSRELQADIQKADMQSAVDMKKAKMASDTTLQVERMKQQSKSIDAKASQMKGIKNESGSNRTPG